MRASPLSFNNTRLYFGLSLFSIQPQLEAGKPLYLYVFPDLGDRLGDYVLNLFPGVLYERLKQKAFLIGNLLHLWHILPRQEPGLGSCYLHRKVMCQLFEFRGTSYEIALAVEFHQSPDAPTPMHIRLHQPLAGNAALL